MIITRRHRLRQDSLWPLITSPASAAQFVVRNLNAAGGSRLVQNMRDLVRDLNEMDRLAREKGFPEITEELIQNQRSQADHLRALGFEKDTIELLTRIRLAFTSYQMRPMPIFPTERGWNFRWMNPWTTKRGMKNLVALVLLGMIHDLATSGKLRRVRQCEHCARWFFARRRDDQRFDKDECREKDYRKSDKGRQKRAKYMRDYRAREKRNEKDFKNLKPKPPVGRSR